MATVDQHIGHTGEDCPAVGRRHGRESLAEVVMIRPARSGLLGSLVTKARGFASPRLQATPVRSTPRRPSSPAPRPSTPQFPYDAA
ncbi:MAG TPA: hypothetical protein VG244_10480 [Acidimicrobiales bacterium]|nr:hypothetical protein [Acidimicrobiales bacterium]